MTDATKAAQPVASIAVLALALLVAGCGGGLPARRSAQDGLRLAPAPLPAYGVGDSFAFDDGRTYTVVSVDRDRLTWDAGSGFRFVGFPDFVAPYLGWTQTDASGRRQSGASEPVASSLALWPLKVGNRVSFRSRDTYTGADDRRVSFEQRWRCWVDGTRTITVPAGRFDTFEVICDRHYENDWAQRIRWFYAPAAGHFVRRIDDYPYRSSFRIDLVAYGPRPTALPPEGELLRTGAVQRALEGNLSEQPLTLRQNGLEVSVTPLRTVLTAEGSFCREYRQELRARSRTSTQQAFACRHPDGEWRTSPLPPQEKTRATSAP